MGNSYFKFKQFQINQDRCAMKVSTEACILGAWTPVSQGESKILDIGAGTGLISLMLAQRSEANITSVEIDANAAGQCQENFDESPWTNRLSVIQANVFDQQGLGKFDLIVSNPPFYSNSLKSDVSSSKNRAKHDGGDFSKSQFAEFLHRSLTTNGKAYILYPLQEAEEFKIEVEKLKLHFNKVLLIKNQAHKDVFRVISVVTKNKISLSNEELIIRDGKEYSEQFTNLLSPYYLFL